MRGLSTPMRHLIRALAGGGVVRPSNGRGWECGRERFDHCTVMGLRRRGLLAPWGGGFTLAALITFEAIEWNERSEA